MYCYIRLVAKDCKIFSSEATIGLRYVYKVVFVGQIIVLYFGQ